MKLILKAKQGLTAKKVTVTRGGKTFQQTVYVKTGEKPTGRDIYTLNIKGKKVSIQAGSQLEAVEAAEKKYGVNYGKDLKISAVQLGESKKKKSALPMIDKMRKIVKEHQAVKIGGKMVDVQTANAIIQIHDNLKPERQKQFMAMPITKMSAVAWNILGKVSGR